MAFNKSKARSPRAWAKVRASGGVGTIATARKQTPKPSSEPKIESKIRSYKKIGQLSPNSKKYYSPLIIKSLPKITKKISPLTTREKEMAKPRPILRSTKISKQIPRKPTSKNPYILSASQQRALEKRLRTDPKFREEFNARLRQSIRRSP